MYKILLAGFTTLLFSTHTLADNENSLNKDDLKDYQKINENIVKYDSISIKNNFSIYFKDSQKDNDKKSDDYINAIQAIIGKNSNSGLGSKDFSLLKENYRSEFYLREGFVKHAMDDDKKPDWIKDKYSDIWNGYVKKLEKVTNQSVDLSLKEKVFFYNQLNSDVATKIFEKCNNKKSDECLSLSEQQKNNLFYQVEKICSGDKQCYSQKLSDIDFQKKLAYENYKLGYYLFDLTKQK